MKKRCLLYFVITSLTLFLLSCSNILQQKTSDIAFKLGDDVVSKISKTIDNSVKESSIIKLQCEFRGIKLKSQSTEIKLSELKTATMVLTDIPYGKEFNILLKIYFNSAVIYQGESNKIILGKDNDGQTVNINISEKRGSYTLDYNGAFDIPPEYPENTPAEYYYDTQDIVLPEYINRDGYEFLGWYANFNTPNELKVTKLGQSNYLGDVTLKAKWISEIYSGNYETGPITIRPGDGKLTLYWENPKYEDFDHVNIYRQTSLENTTLEKLAQVSGTSGELASYEVTGLTNNDENLFVIKTVNKAGDESFGCQPVSGTSGKLVPEADKHNKVEVLPAETLGTYGKNGLYVTFGDYPQTVATAEEEKSINKSELYIFNNMPCYKDIDGNYYVGLDPSPCWNDSSLKEYRDSTQIASGSVKYFKIEPIKWRVLDKNYIDKSGNKKGVLLFAEDILANGNFNDRYTNYEKSRINAFLNCGSIIVEEYAGDNPETYEPIMENHFQNFIVNGLLDNAFLSCKNMLVDIKTSSREKEQKVFLLGKEELINNNGFPEADLSNRGIVVTSRQRSPSDYARATGAFVSKVEKLDWWWTRSEGVDGDYNSKRALATTVEGNVNLNIAYHERDGGVVPAIVVPQSAIGEFSFKPGNITNFEGHFIPNDTNILDFETIPENSSGIVKLTWKESSYNNYSTIHIQLDHAGTKIDKVINKGEEQCVYINMGGLEPDKNYNFSAYTEDQFGNRSDIVTCNVNANKVGYVVLKDGKQVHYKALPENRKNDVVAILFKAMPAESSYEYLGIALQEQTGQNNGLAWATNDKNNICIDNLKCTTNGNAVTDGYIDGEDSWTQICTADTSATTTPEKYPAFNYANTYGTKLPADAAEGLKTKWYIPTIKEILYIYENKYMINNVLNSVGGKAITDWYWWSCNQYTNSDRAFQISLDGGAPGVISDEQKTQTNTVRCIKHFN